MCEHWSLGEQGIEVNNKLNIIHGIINNFLIILVWYKSFHYLSMASRLKASNLGGKLTS